MPTQTAELMHDLRMPLQVIYSCAQLLEEEVGGNARARGYVQALLSGAAEMQQISHSMGLPSSPLIRGEAANL